jgi:hypothetical protein
MAADSIACSGPACQRRIVYFMTILDSYIAEFIDQNDDFGDKS